VIRALDDRMAAGGVVLAGGSVGFPGESVDAR
jgi:hypothetical protein